MSDQIHDCYTCVYKKNVPGNVHKSCTNTTANVEGHELGIRKGYFFWPFCFDPRWVVKCDGYEKK